MADEPILCFDGDKAGPARRLPGLDVALPHAEARQVAALRAAAGRAGPGRPRPLGRRRGDRAGARRRRGPWSTCSGRARPRPARSTRRSAGPRWSGACAKPLGAIRDETAASATTGRRSKRALRQLCPRVGRASASAAQGGRAAAAARTVAAARQRRTRRAAPRERRAPLLARSALFAGGAAESPARGHDPGRSWPTRTCSHSHAETLAELELEGRGTKRLRQAAARLGGRRASRRDADVSASAPGAAPGCRQAADRLDALVAPRRPVDARSACRSVRREDALRQAITLHRRARTLHSELRAAERALAEEDERGQSRLAARGPEPAVLDRRERRPTIDELRRTRPGGHLRRSAVRVRRTSEVGLRGSSGGMVTRFSQATHCLIG